MNTNLQCIYPIPVNIYAAGTYFTPVVPNFFAPSNLFIMSECHRHFQDCLTVCFFWYQLTRVARTKGRTTIVVVVVAWHKNVFRITWDTMQWNNLIFLIKVYHIDHLPCALGGISHSRTQLAGFCRLVEKNVFFIEKTVFSWKETRWQKFAGKKRFCLINCEAICQNQ